MTVTPLKILIAAALALAAPALAQPAPSAFERTIADAKAAMMGEPDKALGLARRAAQVAERTPDTAERGLAIAQAQWLEGEALTRLNQSEPARPIIARAMNTVRALAPRSKLEGDLLMSSATIDWTTGAVPKALEQFMAAHRIFADLKDTRSQAKALQYIGTIYFEARDYERMLKYYAQSAEVHQGDPALMISAYNNQGDALKEMKRFPEAIADYEKALKVARDIDSPVLEVRILTNLASAYLQRGDPALADRFAVRGLERAAGQDTGWEPFLWGVKAQAALARGDLAGAEAHMRRTFANQDLGKTTVQFREFHDSAQQLYAKLGRDREALAHLIAFKRLDDEARDVAASTNSALLGARFDFANQELNIAKLKADRLQGTVELERSKSRVNALAFAALLGGLIVAALVAIGAILAFVSIRRSRNAVARANAELSETNDELEKALGAKTRFLATTSHEIRTPLNGILGMTEVMLHDSSLTSVHRDRLRIVHDAGATMKALVDDILDVAKIETGKITIEREPLDLQPLLEGVYNLWSGQAETKGLALAIDVASAPGRIVGDARRLRQVVFNLMSNAIKFTERGSVSLTARQEGALLQIRVADTGIGIAPEQIEAIFKSFHQVDGEVTRLFGGTGLGLAICRDLARAMGGDVRVESAPGVGSTFIVELPLELADAAAPDEAVERPDSLKAARVLLVESNPLTRSLVAAALGTRVAAVEAVGDLAGVDPAQFHYALIDANALTAPTTLDLTNAIVIAPADASPASLAGFAHAARVLKRPLSLDQLLQSLENVHTLETTRMRAVA